MCQVQKHDKDLGQDGRIASESEQEITSSHDLLVLHSAHTAVLQDHSAVVRPQLLEKASTSMKKYDVLHVEAADLAALLLV
jgi:hypothetical protein